MSETVKIKTQVNDLGALTAACGRLGLAAPVEGEHKLFAEKVTGHAVKLPGWNYPVVFNTATGEAKFDNYNERWGKQAELDKLVQHYAAEKTKIMLRRKGYNPVETKRDGKIVITCNA
jgi:hypothetical protein